MSKVIKELSKTGVWTIQTENPTKEDLQLSCLMRIADASELAAKNYSNLIQEAERYKKWYYEEIAKTKSLQRSVVAHKANYTRLKNKFEALQRAEPYEESHFGEVEK